MDSEVEKGTTIKAMIISTGGTPAPIIKAIIHYRPEFISFLASQDTVHNISDIKKACQEKSVNFKSEITIVDNVNDLLHCFEKAEEAIRRVTDKNFSKDRVIVDYTGGTKNMSVSIALAAISHGFSFSYVGGKERTKNGVGIVIDGSEEIYKSVNPWDFLAVDEKRQIALLFNQYQFMAAKQLCDRLSEKATRQKTFFKKLGFAIEGYYLWDLFRHKDALYKFQRAKIEEIQESGEVAFKELAAKAQKNIRFLEVLIKNSQKLSINYILDIYANAERRFEEGKIDDAILRLYRLSEMIAQERLINRYGIDTSNVKPEQIPANLREEFVRRYKNSMDGKIKLPQNASFELLYVLNDEVGMAFETNKKTFLGIQSSRNQSYLAHGFSFSKDSTYKKLRDFLLGLDVIKIEEAPTFPKIII